MICLAKHLQVKLLLLLAVAALWCLPALAWADTGNASSEEDKAASQIYAIYASGQEGNGANSSNSSGSANSSGNQQEQNGGSLNPGDEVYEPIPGHLETEEPPEEPTKDPAEKPSTEPDNQLNNEQDKTPDNEQNNEQNNNGQLEPPDEPEPKPGLDGDFPALPDSLQVMLWDAASQNNRRTNVVPVNLALSGQYLPSDVPGVAISGRTLVPVRVISEQMQAGVAWEKATNTVTITQGSKTIVLTIGSSTALVDGRPVQVPDDVSVSLVTYEGVARTMVPVRFVVENLSAAVNYDQARRIVNITPPVINSDNMNEEQPPQQTLPEVIPPPGLDENGNLFRRVVVDPGHGGSDPGTNGGGTEEKAVNLAVSLKLKEALQNAGYEVIMARETDEYVSLVDRAALTVQADAPVFVSVHCNSAANIPSANGIETYAAPSDSDDAELAGYIQKAVISATGAKDRGVKTSSLVVLTHNTAPACLVEIGFMSNSEERAKITDPAYQQKLADAIAAGVDAYFAARAQANAQTNNG